MAQLTINGTDIATYGVVVNSITDWLTVTPITYRTAQLLGYRGEAVVEELPVSVQNRVMQVLVTLTGSSLSDYRAKLNTLLAAMRGKMTISTAEDPTKVIFGYLTKAPAVPFGVQFVSNQIQVTFEITCYDPTWYDSAQQTLTIAAAATDYSVPMGGLPMRKSIFHADGPFTNLVITMKDGAGNVLQTMTLTGAVLAGDSLEVDNDLYTVTHTVSGVAQNAIDWMGSSDTFFLLDPALSPKVRFSNSTGTVKYYRPYFA